ncbi:MAG: FAD-binding oxidoreductase [Cyanobacteria bacterium P01_G01_bin.54]
MPNSPAAQLQALPDLELADASSLAPAAQQLLTTWEEEVPLVLPTTLDAFSALLRLAHQERWTSIVVGRGSKLDWGNVPQRPQLLISTQKLNQVLDHAVGDLTITVEAGVTLAQVQTVLREHQQFLPLDPAYPETATLGGIVATADTGSLRQRYSGVRDLILGIEMVRADGQRAKAGGRVVKNVAGYDLMKLLTGSYGTLGAIAQLTFRTYPLPPTQTSVWITGKPEAIAALTAQVRGSSLTPIAFDLLSTGIVNQISADMGLGLLLTFATIPESIAVQLATVKGWAEAMELKVQVLSEPESQSRWDAVATLIRQTQTSAAVTVKFGIMPTAGTAFLEQLPPTAYGCLYAGSGLGHAHFPTTPTATDLKRLRRLCEQHQGFLSLLQGPAALKAEMEPWGYTGDALWLMQRLKQEFDPENVLHPGCFVGGI